VAKGDVGVQRTRAEVEALIEQVGRTPPGWFGTTVLNYPKRSTSPGPNGRKVRGTTRRMWAVYLDVINPNPAVGEKECGLMHHLLVVHKDYPEKQAMIMNRLG